VVVGRVMGILEGGVRGFLVEVVVRCAAVLVEA
jgi:hypothetical protein